MVSLTPFYLLFICSFTTIVAVDVVVVYLFLIKLTKNKNDEPRIIKK